MLAHPTSDDPAHASGGVLGLLGPLGRFLGRRPSHDDASGDDEAHAEPPRPAMLPYDDLESLESGHAREVLTTARLAPVAHARRWTQCRIRRRGKDSFWLFADGPDRFLLSAVRVGREFYLSQYEDFPDGVAAGEAPRQQYCAVVRADASGRGFRLVSTACEHCDGAADKYTCGGASGERQVLAEIEHDARLVGDDAVVRCTTARLPLVSPDGRGRAVWCPRTRNHEATALRTKLPEWNEGVRSLVQKFNGGRVGCSSSKNLLLSLPGDLERPAAAAKLQFGKSGFNRYVLDFRHPIAPIQAFAVALTSFVFDKKMAARR